MPKFNPCRPCCTSPPPPVPCLTWLTENNITLGLPYNLGTTLVKDPDGFWYGAATIPAYCSAIITEPEVTLWTLETTPAGWNTGSGFLTPDPFPGVVHKQHVWPTNTSAEPIELRLGPEYVYAGYLAWTLRVRRAGQDWVQPGDINAVGLGCYEVQADDSAPTPLRKGLYNGVDGFRPIINFSAGTIGVGGVHTADGFYPFASLGQGPGVYYLPPAYAFDQSVYAQLIADATGSSVGLPAAHQATVQWGRSVDSSIAAGSEPVNVKVLPFTKVAGVYLGDTTLFSVSGDVYLHGSMVRVPSQITSVVGHGTVMNANVGIRNKTKVYLQQFATYLGLLYKRYGWLNTDANIPCQGPRGYAVNTYTATLVSYDQAMSAFYKFAEPDMRLVR